MSAIERLLEREPEIDDVVDMLTMMVGVDRVLLCVRLDFIDKLESARRDRAIVRADRGTIADRLLPELRRDIPLRASSPHRPEDPRARAESLRTHNRRPT